MEECGRTSSGISATFLANCGHLHLLKILSQCGEMREDDELSPNHQKKIKDVIFVNRRSRLKWRTRGQIITI